MLTSRALLLTRERKTTEFDGRLRALLLTRSPFADLVASAKRKSLTVAAERCCSPARLLLTSLRSARRYVADCAFSETFAHLVVELENGPSYTYMDMDTWEVGDTEKVDVLVGYQAARGARAIDACVEYTGSGEGGYFHDHHQNIKMLIYIIVSLVLIACIYKWLLNAQKEEVYHDPECMNEHGVLPPLKR